MRNLSGGGAVRGGRGGLVAIAMTALGLLGVAPALAGPAPGLDRSYGQDGSLTVEPPPPAGYKSTYAADVAVAPAGAAYVVASVSPCPFPCGESASYLYRYLPSGALDSAFGGGGAVRLEGAANWRVGVDDRDRPLLVGMVENGLRAFRYTAAGALDSGFGPGGSVSLAGREGFLRSVAAAPGGRILLVESGSLEGGEGEFGAVRAHRLHLVRLLPDGRLDPRFGHRGELGLDLPGEFDAGVAFANRGAMLIGGTGCCGDPISVTRVSVRGAVDTRFDAVAARSLGRLSGLGGDMVGNESSLGAVVPRPHGGLDLFGGDGLGAGFELRLRGDGRLATGFGRRGLRMLPKPVTTAIAAPRGGVFAISAVAPELLAMSLLPGGRLDPAFGGGQPVAVPNSGFGSDLVATRPRRAVVVAQGLRECRAQCPLSAVLTRFIEPAGKRGGKRGNR